MAQYEHPNFETDKLVEQHYRDGHEAILEEVCNTIEKSEPNLCGEELQQRALDKLLEIREESCILMKRQEAENRREASETSDKTRPKFLKKKNSLRKIKQTIFFKKLKKAEQRRDMLQYCLHKVMSERVENNLLCEVKNESW